MVSYHFSLYLSLSTHALCSICISFGNAISVLYAQAILLFCFVFIWFASNNCMGMHYIHKTNSIALMRINTTLFSIHHSPPMLRCTQKPVVGVSQKKREKLYVWYIGWMQCNAFMLAWFQLPFPLYKIFLFFILFENIVSTAVFCIPQSGNNKIKQWPWRSWAYICAKYVYYIWIDTLMYFHATYSGTQKIILKNTSERGVT